MSSISSDLYESRIRVIQIISYISFTVRPPLIQQFQNLKFENKSIPRHGTWTRNYTATYFNSNCRPLPAKTNKEN